MIASSGIEALHAELLRTGGTLAARLRRPARLTSRPGVAQLAAAGPRARGREAEYELLLEMIFEGSLLHYGRPRLVGWGDPDLALLLGDQLYALGLRRLAALDDVAAVRELGDLISLLAQAHVQEDPGLVDALWEASASAVGWGATGALEAAKALARAGDPAAADALRQGAAAARAADRRGDAEGSHAVICTLPSTVSSTSCSTSPAGS